MLLTGFSVAFFQLCRYMMPTPMTSMNDTTNCRQISEVRRMRPLGDRPNEPFSTSAGGKDVKFLIIVFIRFMILSDA